jgi:probable HAF family extracellular repeat protein
MKDLCSRKLLAAAFLVALSLCGTATVRGQTPEYVITDLGTLTNMLNSTATAINDFGQVVGSSYDASYTSSSAFLYSNSSMQNLGTLGRTYSLATGINDSGQISGWLHANTSDTNHAMSYSNGVMQDLGALSYSPNDLSYGYGINAAGQIAGQTSTSSSLMHAAIFSNGGIQDLGTVGLDSNSSANAINTSGQVTGWSGQYLGQQKAFLYSPGSGMTTLGTLGGTNSVGYGINDSGMVTGQSDTAGGGSHAFLYTSSSGMSDLGTLGGTSSIGRGINNAGQVVGTSATATATNHAFLYTSGTMMDLNSLVPTGAGAAFSYLEDANAINNKGDIVGDGITTNGQTHAFLATYLYSTVPIPTSTPALNLLPAPDGHAISTFVDTIIPQYGSQISTPSLTSLTTNATSVAPLVSASSPSNLKNSIANGLATGLSSISTAVDVVTTGLSSAPLDEKVFDIQLSLAGQFLPQDEQTVASTLTFAGSALKASIADDPAAFLVAGNLYIWGTVLPNELRAYGQDPPDPNFQTVIVPQLVLPTLPTTGNAQLDAAFTLAITDGLKAATYLSAVNTSFNRYSGAIEAGDNIHAVLQMEALLNYLSLYNQATQAQAADISAVSSLLGSLGLLTGTYDPQSLIALQDGLQTNGLPSDVISLLQQLGLTTDQINQVDQSVLSLDANSYSGTFADNTTMASDTLLQGTTAVPEPGSSVLLTVTSCLLLTCRRRRRKTT